MSDQSSDLETAETKDAGAATEAEAPMNRAERRAAAKHKGNAPHQQFGHGGNNGSRPQVGRPVGGAGQVKMPRKSGGA